MSKASIFTRTSLGNGALDDPYGTLRGDEKRLLALIDGRVSFDDICDKVPLSVRPSLDDIFTRLVSARLIAKVERPVDKLPAETHGQAGLNAEANELSVVRLALERERRIELERELAELRVELSAMTAREARVNASCDMLRQQVAEYANSLQAKLAQRMQMPSVDTDDEKDWRVEYECESREAFEMLTELSQSMCEQKEQLDKTLELPAFQVKFEVNKAEKSVVSDPQYSRLRGLDFFTAFSNAELIDLLTFAKWRKVEAGETVLQAGEVGMPFFIIVSGSVDIFEGSRCLASLAKGDSFGEFSHLSGEAPLRSAHVMVTSACEFLMVEPLDIEFSSLQIRLHVAEALLRGQVRKLLHSNQFIRNLSDNMNTSAL